MKIRYPEILLILGYVIPAVLLHFSGIDLRTTATYYIFSWFWSGDIHFVLGIIAFPFLVLGFLLEISDQITLWLKVGMIFSCVLLLAACSIYGYRISKSDKVFSSSLKLFFGVIALWFYIVGFVA